jgi:D-alanyl-D-alanine carboxypeptidase/D-alanyl-D-alanine-endopeptidase (penicillin-binding protein 4)
MMRRLAIPVLVASIAACAAGAEPAKGISAPAVAPAFTASALGAAGREAHSAPNVRKGKPSRNPPARRNALLSGPDFTDEATVAWALLDASGDSLIEGKDPGRNLTPGSTVKLFTTWLALETLGPEKTLSTRLYRTGPLKDGVLQGDLIIQGGGDPGFAGSLLGPAHQAEAIFRAWHEALAREGIRKVAGCVIGDGSYLEEDGPHPAGLWEDVGNYYAGTSSGLSFHDNLYALSFDGAAAPDKPVKVIGVRPAHAGIARFDNRLVTGPPGSRDSAYILGGHPSPVRLLRGAYPAGRMPFSIKGSLPNPAWTCAREFRDYLASRGIDFQNPDGPACGDSLALPNRPAPVYAQAKRVAAHESAPVKELVRVTNQRSDNNYAAQLLALSGKASGRDGNFHGGLEAMREYFHRNAFVQEEIHLRDGTGLSRYNWVSPAQTAHLLSVAFRSKSRDAFRASLVGAPGSGKKLERYGSGWNGRLYVKTGTLEGVASLAGYLKADSGRWLAFAVIANNFSPRSGIGRDGSVVRGDPQKAFIPLLRRWAASY